MMDWVIQSTHAPFLLAQSRGYFKDAGVTVESIDSGKGASNVAVSVAGGAYQFGWVDLPTMIMFNAKNPDKPLLAVYVSFDQTPLSIITRKDAGIRSPADLDGKRIAGGPGIAVHDTISILLKGAHAEGVKINWLPVSPQLYGPMLRRGEVDGIAGFTNSLIPAAVELGFKLDEIVPIRYADYGADMYGLALVTPKAFADQEPETVRGVVAALNRGTLDTIASPTDSLAALRAREPLMKPEAEKLRLDFALQLTVTPHVRDNGLSSVTPEKLNRTIDAMVSAYSLPTRPDPSTIYTDRFLPPLAERMPPR